MKHSLIDLWTAEHDLPLDTGGARRQVSVTIDRVRLHLRELPDASVLAWARVMDLPSQPRELDERLNRVLVVGTARMRHSPAVAAVDEEAATVSLQLTVPPQSDLPALNRAVEHLVNEVETWRAVM